MKIKFYKPKQLPKPSVDAPEFSDDVFIVDEDGLHGIAYYSFEDKRWCFHTDTLCDYSKGDIKWRWYYPPFDYKQIFKK
jgi:hypothetical protein